MRRYAWTTKDGESWEVERDADGEPILYYGEPIDGVPRVAQRVDAPDAVLEELLLLAGGEAPLFTKASLLEAVRKAGKRRAERRKGIRRIGEPVIRR